MVILIIGVVAALAWSFLFVVVLGLCKVASRADAGADYRHASDRVPAHERLRAHERMRPAAL
jgi:hypothetical protein